MATILAFDMGIRNLAYCLIQHSVDLSGVLSSTILDWNNIDLLEGAQSAEAARSCYGCNSKSIQYNDKNAHKWCKSCATKTRVKKSVIHTPSYSVLPCKLNVTELKKLSGMKNMKKEELLNWAKENYLLPWKPTKASTVSLDIILISIDSWLDSILPTISVATLIKLENQPVLKGPTMKSVQIILYTLLSHRLKREFNWSGKIEFVHAGVKSKNVSKTDLSGSKLSDSDAYKARKNDAIDDTLKILTDKKHDKWLLFFNSNKKKSDLADAFLMANRWCG